MIEAGGQKVEACEGKEKFCQGKKKMLSEGQDSILTQIANEKGQYLMTALGGYCTAPYAKWYSPGKSS